MSSAFGLALVASLALAVVTTGSASALGFKAASNPKTFSVSDGVQELWSNGYQTQCESLTGSGNFSSETSGQMTLVFSNCVWHLGAFQWTCTTSGQPQGTIKVSSLDVKPVYLDAGKTKYGLMLSPPASASNVFAQFTCAGISRKWTGSVLGQITNPALNENASKFILDFAITSTSAGEQKYRQIEGVGPVYQLSDTYSGSTFQLGFKSHQTATVNQTFQFVP